VNSLSCSRFFHRGTRSPGKYRSADALHSQLQWSARGGGRRASRFALPRRASPPKSTEPPYGRESREAPPILISRVIQRMSADVDDARLGLCLSWRLRLCRKLKHRCLLTLMQVCQENKRAIGKFECVVMHLWYVLVDLSKDRRSGAYCSPAKETGRRTYHLRGKGELRSGKKMQTAVVESSGAANPHVPVMKLWVVRLSPTFAGRDLTLCRLKSHMAEELLSCERPTNPDPLAKNGQ
jgi:hypothetical protein